MANRVLNVGLIGGGGGAFIVHPHQRAIHMDGTRRVTCGALHEDPAKALEFARNWPYPITGYASYDDLVAAESKKPAGERIDYALIVTPNFAHFDPAMKLVKAGIPVFCEKPLTTTAQESVRLAKAVEKARVPFGVAHTYIGHWTSRFARWVVTSGKLGPVRWADSYYLQGWLATRAEKTGNQQASWRTDPKRAGGSGCGGDIGTHAYMQLRFVTGLEVVGVRAALETFVKGRQLDDHFTTYCELSNGGKALIRASQICIGQRNNLGIEVACEKGSLAWRQEDSEVVTVRLPDGIDRRYYRGAVPADDAILGKVPAELLAESTIPSGHAEAFHDAFGRLHRFFEEDVRAYNDGRPFACDGTRYANVHDGVKHMAFIEAAIKSAKANSRSVPLTR